MYTTGNWGTKAKARSKRRLEYFKEYAKKHKQKYRYKLVRKFNGYGSFGELIGLKVLKNSILVRKSGFDLIWNNKKIEVKISTYNDKRRRWQFMTGRQKSKTDYYLLILMKTDKKTIYKIYLIPEQNIPNLKTFHLKENKNEFDNFILESEVK